MQIISQQQKQKRDEGVRDDQSNNQTDELSDRGSHLLSHDGDNKISKIEIRESKEDTRRSKATERRGTRGVIIRYSQVKPQVKSIKARKRYE